MTRLARVCVLIVALVLLTAAAASAANVIYVRNDESSGLSDADVAASLPAFQLALDRDFGPIWGVGATLTADPAAAAIADMQINLLDESPEYGALGFHDVYSNKPVAYVFVKDSEAVGEAWPLIFSHELWEMLVDPWVDRVSQDPLTGKMWAVEVADPVESGYYAYFINNVPISDFVTPAWYNLRRGQPYDFMRKLKKPHAVGRHGYAQYYDFRSQRWNTLLG